MKNTRTVTARHTLIAAYHGCEEAERAMVSLHETGFPLSQIAIVGNDWERIQAQSGAHDTGQNAIQGSNREGVLPGAGIGGITGILASFVLIPLTGIAIPGILMGVTASAVGGILVSGLLGSVEGQLSMEDLSSEYQSWLIEGDFLVVAHGAPEEIAQAHLDTTGPHHVRLYPYNWE